MSLCIPQRTLLVGSTQKRLFPHCPSIELFLVHNVLDCRTVYNDIISCSVLGTLWRWSVVCLWHFNHSLLLHFRYFSWSTTSFLHKDCFCGFPFSNYISDWGETNVLQPSPNSCCRRSLGSSCEVPMLLLSCKNREAQLETILNIILIINFTCDCSVK